MNYSMNLGANPSFFSSAFAVSVVLHGIALVVLSNAFLAKNNLENQPIRLEIPTLKTIEVSLKSVPSQASEHSQIDRLIPEKKAALSQASNKQSITANAIKTTLSKKSITLAKPTSEPKKNKVAKLETMKASNRQKAKIPDLVLSKASEQNYVAHENLTVSDAPSPPITKTTPYAKEQPISETKDNNNKLANNSNVTSLAAKHTISKSADFPTGISSALPPLLKSRQPDYPEEARWEERTGKTFLKFKISAQGRVTEPKITKSSGHRDLDLAAIQAIQFWRFKATESQASNQWYQYSFRFELN